VKFDLTGLSGAVTKLLEGLDERRSKAVEDATCVSWSLDFCLRASCVAVTPKMQALRLPAGAQAGGRSCPPPGDEQGARDKGKRQTKFLVFHGRLICHTERLCSL